MTVNKIFTAIVLFFLVSCAEDDSNSGTINSSSNSKTVLEIVNSRDDLDSLNNLINRQPDLLQLLSDPDLSITLFAPVNTVFEDFYSNSAFSDLGTSDLDSIISHHLILDAKILFSSLAGLTLPSEYIISNGERDDITITQDGFIQSNNPSNIQILTSDISAVNGIVHTIDNFIFPSDYLINQNPQGSKTIAELVSETAGLDSLFYQLSEFPDLVAALSDTSGNYTVFAPNNQAFINLLATPGFPSAFDFINPDIIKGVLSYHVVPGQLISSGNLGPDMATLYQDPATGTIQVIKVNQDGTLLTGSTNEAIMVVTADIQASNGVIHIVNSVMIPPSVGATLTPILGTIAGTVLLGSDFSILAQVVGLADSDVPAGMPPVAGVLADTSSIYTVFGPPNAVLENVDISGFTPASARALLLNHVISGLNLSTSLSNDTVQTLGGNDLIINIDNGVQVGLVGGAGLVPVVQPDVTNNISNGVIHVIAGVIQ